MSLGLIFKFINIYYFTFLFNKAREMCFNVEPFIAFTVDYCSRPILFIFVFYSLDIITTRRPLGSLLV